VSAPRILTVEDDEHLRKILRMQLENAGFTVIEASDGAQGLAIATREIPDLILLDVMMPNMDGYEVCRRLRSSFSTRQIPVIFLTAKTEEGDRLVGLEGGANDYITKPWNGRELMLRVHNGIEWSRQQRSASPLTGLPGNVSIGQEIGRRIAGGEPFSLLQLDIDHFKAFNDKYGYARGDVAIQTLAKVLVDAAARHGGDANFVGHIGGDDFVVLSTPDHAEEIGEEVIAEFKTQVLTLYAPADLEAGFVEVRNRLHQLDRFPLMSITIALVSTDRMPVTHVAQLLDIAQELKAHGKGIPGCIMVGERRRRSAPGARPQAERHAA
jgi:diguanylate cyclase (GGDEF)-like protein